MKHFLLIAFSLLLLNFKVQAAPTEGSTLKIEGTCSGTLKDGSTVNLTYYSNFDGIKDVSQSAVTFTGALEGLFTGTRQFKQGKDIYTFPGAKLIFLDSTGNTSGTLQYSQEEIQQSVDIQCEIRDYEYAEAY